MAADDLLPKVLTRTHHKYGTPWVSIVFLAAVNAVLVRWGFQTLIVIDVFLMMLYDVLIFVAAVALRLREPGLERPFRAKGGTATLTAICAPAVAIAIVALFTNGGDWLIGGLAGVLTGPIAYLVFKPLCRPKLPAPAAPHSALKSVGRFSHESVEKRQSALGGCSTLSSSPWCVASSTPAGASSR